MLFRSTAPLTLHTLLALRVTGPIHDAARTSGSNGERQFDVATIRSAASECRATGANEFSPRPARNSPSQINDAGDEARRAA